MLSSRIASVFLAASIVGACVTAKPAAAQGPVELVSIVVESIDVVDGQLVADLLATLSVDGVEDLVEVPITGIPLDLFAAPGDPCPILFLSIGAIDLDLLGLVIELDDCTGEAVTVEIVADPTGGLLGSLLCGLLGGLDLDDLLGDLLGALDGDQLDVLTGILEQVLNELFADLLNQDNGNGDAQLMASHPGQGQGHGQGQGGGRGQGRGHGPGGGQGPPGNGGNDDNGNGQTQRCDILNLEIPEGIFLDLLGLEVQTSGICLDVYAVRGDGNLLGNLLCTLTGLLDGPGNLGNAPQALLNNINRILDRLDL